MNLLIYKSKAGDSIKHNIKISILPGLLKYDKRLITLLILTA